MSDFVTRAKALNLDIKKANRASEESRTRLKVRKEQFIAMLEEFGTQEGIDLVSEYTEGGLDQVEAVLLKLHTQASEKLESEVAVSQKIIEAYGKKDFATIDNLLGKPKAKAKAKEPVKVAEVEVPKVVEPVEAVEEEEVVALEEAYGQVNEAESVFAKIARSNNEEASASKVEAPVSVFDAVADVDEEPSTPAQSTQPSLAGFGFGSAKKTETKQEEAPAKVKSTMSLFTDDGDEDYDKPVNVKKPAKADLFKDDDDEDDAAFGDISLGQILGTNVNTGGPGF